MAFERHSYQVRGNGTHVLSTLLAYLSYLPPVQRNPSALHAHLCLHTAAERVAHVRMHVRLCVLMPMVGTMHHQCPSAESPTHQGRFGVCIYALKCFFLKGFAVVQT